MWFEEKFVKPLCHYYTPEATLVYGILLIICAFIVFKVLNKLNIKIDKRFFIAFLPFIIYGGWTRALRDHRLGIYDSAWWCSPPIYFIVFSFAFSALLVGLAFQKKFKIPYERTSFLIGCLFLLYNASLTYITNFIAVKIVFAFMLFWLVAIAALIRFKVTNQTNGLILLSHMLDASSSYTAITFFNYYEQHVLPSVLMKIFGPWSIFPLKFFIVLAILLYVDKERNVQLRNYIKFIILILGLALGIRDFLTITMLSI